MGKSYSEKLRQRFWAKVKRGKANECWEWLASTYGNGYGRVKVEGRVESAHRIVWSLTHGPIPDGLCVLHKCDNPGCVNPYHLFLGTHADNMADMKKKHRGRGQLKPGELHLCAKLTLRQVKTIRKEGSKPGVTQTALATAFSVSQSHISRIILGRRWQ